MSNILKIKTEVEEPDNNPNFPIVKIEVKTEERNICEFCNVEFPNENLLKEHINLTHETRIKVEVDPYNVFLADSTQFTQLYKCDQCGKVVKSKRILNNHRRVHRGKLFECAHCGKKFTFKDNLRRHIQLRHSKSVLLKCTLCDKSFKSKEYLQRHFKSHQETPEGIVHTCQFCKRCYAKKASLREHIRRQHNSQQATFQCDKCTAVCKTKCDLKRHLSTHEEKTHQCELCEKKYTFKDSLKIHMESCHDPKLEPFKCNQCDKTFSVNSYLQKHLKTHRENFQHVCPLCKKCFVLNENLQIHIQTQHNQQQKSFECSECRRVMKTQKGLTNHMERVHRNK